MKKRTLIASSLCAAVLVGIIAVTASRVEAQQASSAPDIFAGRDMSIGSTGADVVQLQGLLSELGYLQVPFGVPLGYYGSLTQSAVAKYQQSLGVSNTGYYGPQTKFAMKTAFALKGWLSLLYPSVYGTR